MFACLLAVVLRSTDVAAPAPAPAPMLESVRLVGSLVVPLMLLSLGYALVTVSRAGIRQDTVLGAMRLLIGLFTSALVVHLINLPPLVAGVMTLQFALPVAVVNCIYVKRFSTYGDDTGQLAGSSQQAQSKPGRWKTPKKLSCSICPAIALASVARVSAWQVTARGKCLSQKTRQSNSPCPKTTPAQTCSKLTE